MLIVLIMMILIIMMIIMMLLMTINTEKLESIKRLFEGFDRDYYKPIKTDDSFDGKINSYIEYRSREIS